MNRQNPLPSIRTRQLSLFTTYVRFYLRRNFHGLHLLNLAELRDLNGYPLLVCLNHPSWWDPLVALYLSQRFLPQRRHYAPVAAKAIGKYKFFERLGFFGIDGETRAGAARFLRVGEAVLNDAQAAYWVTPQGAFTDIRCRPVKIAGGVGRLAHRLHRFAMLPVALEYAFWNERYPEAFACLGAPEMVNSGRSRSDSDWTALFARRMEETQDTLSAKVLARDPRAFHPLNAGRAGVGGVYDLWRSLKSRLQGKPWTPEHEERRV